MINPSGVYHAVWSRDLYEIVTALIVEGDLAGAGRALDYLFNVQQKPDGSFPQNSKVDGTTVFGSLQLDEVADPIILAYQLGRKDATTWSQHVKPAANLRGTPSSHRGRGPKVTSVYADGVKFQQRYQMRNRNRVVADTRPGRSS